MADAKTVFIVLNQVRLIRCRDMLSTKCIEPVTNATRLECMPSSKGGKEFAEQQFRYTISELTRTKLNGFYREAIDSLFKNFQIKF